MPPSFTVNDGRWEVGMDAGIEERTALRNRLVEHRMRNEKWGRISFYIAQTFAWLTVVASFAAAVLSAGGLLTDHRFLVAVLAAIPGAVIVVDKRFAFAKRAQWHNVLGARVERIENALLFEGKSVRDASQELSGLLEAMYEVYPSTIPPSTIPASTTRSLPESGQDPG
jgi:hypothetical protein